MSNKTKKRKYLTPVEEAILNVIVAQRNENIDEDGKDRGDIFRYDEDKGQALLNRNGAATKYGIGRDEQLEVLRWFRKVNLIDVEWTVPHPDGWPVMAHPYSHWAMDELMMYHYPYEDEHHQELYFIRIGHNRIKKIYDYLVKKHKAQLIFDEGANRFMVKVDNGKKFTIKKIRRRSPAFKVLKIAVMNPGEIILRDDINDGDYGDEVHIGKLSIATQVFDDGSIVRNELAPFVDGEMTSESVRIVKDGTTELTQVQIDAIERISF